MSSNELASKLTDAQQEVVAHIDGPLLVLAGPGSGKTTVVTQRIANLISSGVQPWNILALTFTNKAAQEMRDRVLNILEQDSLHVRGLTVSTFHSFCARVLRDWGDRIIGTNSFTIYDTSDQKSAVKQAIRECELSDKNWRPSSVLSAISSAKNKLTDVDTFEQEAFDFYSKSIAKLYRAYENVLRRNDAVDFDDLLLKTAQLLSRDQEVKQSLEDRYQYLMIDEYQDTNHAQFVIANCIAANHRNICVVGDPDQSIYAWRGADISNILEFEEHYPNATVIPLGRNFRSTGHIVAASASLIEQNRYRKSKKLYTELDDGNQPIVVAVGDEHQEAERIISEVNKLRDEGVPPKEMAVLYRVNALSRVLEDSFRNASIPYVVARGTAFYDRKEIKQALSYLRLLVNPKDDVAFSRIINTPTRGIGATTLNRLVSLANAKGMSLLETTEITTKDHGFTSRAVASMNKFANTCKQWSIDGRSENSLTAAGSLADLVERVIRESGLEEFYSKTQAEDDSERLQNLEELVSAASEFEERFEEDDDSPPTPLHLLYAFLENVALVSDADAVDPRNGAVTLMTLHAAKGLEFDFVAIIGLEEGLLPHERSRSDEHQLEEERRICYVGITRARKHLLLTNAYRRTQRGISNRTIISRFIQELSGVCSMQELTKDPWDIPDVDINSNEITVDTVVRHKRFGVGKVIRVIRRPRGSTVSVRFSGGTKHLVLEYAKLEIVQNGISPNF
ncbi:MAG: UvrD-helicase domain-containing protein [Phycisphaerales bacterium]|jgi:DNA helicase-2/ATP-dependent DNA helicase PcrA|nr:UvrD-helicase domain-containing protein [Phycisphaerales bacterium]